MKRILYAIMIIALALSLAACNAPAAKISDETVSPVPATPVPDAQDSLKAALMAATTVDEVGQIMKPYTISGDYESALLCADRMLEIDPEYSSGWYAQAELRLQMIKALSDELGVVVTKGMEAVDDPAGYVDWVKQYAENSGITLTLPFVPDYASDDEINTYGVASANYYNGGGVYSEWQNGLLTSQGKWVYFTVPAEGYAIYKMRADGTDKRRFGEENGCCLNVVGDWLYYCNLNENNSIYKMRTDGSERTKVSDDSCKYMAVCGEWIVYANTNENDSLYKMKLNGSERTLVVQSAVQYPYLYNERIYFKLRDERSLCSVAPDGSGLVRLAQYIEGYCIEGDFIYCITDDRGMVVIKMNLDGSEQTEAYRFAGKGGYALFADGSLIVNDNMKNSDHEQAIAVDLGTMEKTVLVDNWCEAFFVAGGRAYYLNYEEGNAWYYLDLASGETGRLE